MILADSKRKVFFAFGFLVAALCVSAVWGFVLGHSVILALALVVGAVYFCVVFFNPFYAALAFLFAVPLGPLLNLPITDGGFLLALAVAFTGLVVWIFKALVLKDTDLWSVPASGPIYALMFFFLVAMTVSLLNTSNLGISLLQIKRFFYCIAVYFFVNYTIRNEKQLKMGMAVLLVSYTIAALLGIWEAVSGKNIYELLNQRSLLGAHLPPAVLRLSETRLNGVIGNPEFYSIRMLTFLVFLLYPLFSDQNKTKRLGIVLLILLALANIVGTAFRGAAVGMTAALFTFFILGKVRLKWVMLPVCAVLVVVVGIWAYAIFPQLDIERLTATTESELRTVGLRKRNTIIGLEMALKHPLIGNGPDGFVLQYTRYAHMLPEAVMQEIKAHNTYIQILAEYGLVGFSVFSLLLIITLNRMARIARKMDGPAHYLVLSILAAFAAHVAQMVGTNYLLDLNFWMVFALAGVVGKIYSDRPDLSPERT